jgi:Rps23 Pro-64 3,4-dihydroxylase Tpa1-like proline 4-hydroxylase
MSESSKQYRITSEEDKLLLLKLAQIHQPWAAKKQTPPQKIGEVWDYIASKIDVLCKGINCKTWIQKMCNDEKIRRQLSKETGKANQKKELNPVTDIEVAAGIVYDLIMEFENEVESQNDAKVAKIMYDNEKVCKIYQLMYRRRKFNKLRKGLLNIILRNCPLEKLTRNVLVRPSWNTI